MADISLDVDNITLQIENLFNKQIDENRNESTLSFHNITLNAKDIDGKKTKILKSISGEFKSGRLSLVLGPSGAGKTSLLNVLSGFKQKNVLGNIYYNNKTYRNPSEYRKLSSYITQDFGMFENLKVKETINFSANMKLSKESKEKVCVINDIIKVLNISKCSNSLVSKLSGGERKRLSIAVELVTNPPIMLFDEPTSGLDIVSSTQILNYLKSLALTGRIIVCVVHQPSSHLMKLFNDALVIADGHNLYSGSVDNMVEYFKNWGLVCPNYYNPADFVLEIASGDYGETKLMEIINDGLENSKSLSLKEEKVANTVEAEGVETQSKPLVVAKEETIENEFFKDANHGKFSRTFFQQVHLLIERSLRSQMRDFMCVQLRIIVHLFVGVLIGVVFWDIGSEASKILSNSSCLFFFSLFVFFSNAMPSVLSCPLETSVFLREHLNGWYSIESYFVSKLLSDLPLLLICPTLFMSLAYYFTGQPMELERFAQAWLIVLLTTMLGHSIGLTAGSAVNLKLAIFLVPSSCIPMLIFSGFFIRFHELSVYLQPLTYVSYFRYSMEGLIQAIYGNNRTDLKCSIPFCYYRTAKKYLQDMNMDGDVYLYDIIALISWTLLFYIALYISLVIKVRKAQA